MRKYFCPITFVSLVLLFASCKGSREIVYNFGSGNVSDSIVINLREYGKKINPNGQETKWIALLRESQTGYEIIVNELSATNESPFKSLVKKTSRYIKLDNGIKIPLIFDSDVLSEDIKKLNIGGFNFGGYYFKIVKDNNEYKVIETGVLF